MNILFFSRKKGNTKDRALALKRLGHEVFEIYPEDILPKNKFLKKLLYHTGGVGYGHVFWKKIKKQIRENKYDICFLNQENFLSKRVVTKIKENCSGIIQYINDDPFNGKNKLFWHAVRSSIPLYNMVVVVREPNVKEAKALGAQKVLKVYMSADDIRHAEPQLSDEDIRRYKSDVLFVGTFFEDRDIFMYELIKEGVDVHIYGNNWEKSKIYSKIKKHVKSTAVTGNEYAKVIKSSKISLCLLSKNNRDEYTTRSMEIPSIGTFMLAQRSGIHKLLYKEGEEAEFFSDIEECKKKIKYFLNNDIKREEIAYLGHLRFLKNKHTVTEQIKCIIESYEQRNI
ncbi:glycosyltransferase [Kiritimatiellaeota bacterium B1221]|nr:glycosyltransferase [Kiritimatiellaeota bacterium B1221]